MIECPQQKINNMCTYVLIVCSQTQTRENSTERSS